MIRGEVRTRLLDSAQALCARNGVGATSIRGVIGQAGANLNAVHYHFGSRAALIDAVSERAMEALNRERFARFELVEADMESLSPEEATRRILAAGYGPLFDQALGPQRARTREGLLVVGQLRNDPLGADLPVMQTHSARYVERIESLLQRVLGRTPARLRPGMQLVNAAAWDSALRPDMLARVENARAPKPMLRRFCRGFLDFAVAGLLTTSSRANP